MNAGGLDYGDGSNGGRPPLSPVSMFEALILLAQPSLRGKRLEFMIRARLSSIPTSAIHRRKPPGTSMSIIPVQTNAKTSSVRAAVEHVFAQQ